MARGEIKFRYTRRSLYIATLHRFKSTNSTPHLFLYHDDRVRSTFNLILEVYRPCFPPRSSHFLAQTGVVCLKLGWGLRVTYDDGVNGR